MTDLIFYQELHSLISSSYDKTIRLWDLDSAALLKTFKKHDEPVLGLVLLNDLYGFCSSSADKSLQFWDIETYEPKFNYKIEAKINKMLYVNTGENKHTLICACTGGFLYWIVNLETQKLDIKKKNKAHNSSINHLFYIQTHKILLTCGNDKSVKIWDINTKELAKELIINEDIIIPQIFYDNFNDIIITGSSDGFIRIMKIKDYKVIKEIKEDLYEFGFVYWVYEKNVLLISGKQKQKNFNQSVFFIKTRCFS